MSSISTSQSDLHFSFVRKLSMSKYPVYLATDTKTKQYLAIKTFPLEDTNFQKEKSMLRSLSHPHIVKFLGTQEHIHYGEKSVSCVELEYAPYGDLLEIIQKRKKIPEVLARTLFHNLIDAMEYLHKNNIAHLDLKVDNLLIDENFDLKITDFDLAQEIDSIHKGAFSKGTPGSRAPELIKSTCEDFEAADIFSAGIILFIMISGCPPYVEVKKGDSYGFDTYYDMLRNRSADFWALHSKHRGDKDFYSEDFKDLFMKMIDEDPVQRLTMSEIKESQWYKGTILTREECREEFRKYLKK